MYPIDLRSDTLTSPTDEMRRAMASAVVGDDGRTDSQGRGGDPMVNKLEDMAAELLDKEAALFCCSGTMANVLATITHCNRGDKVAVEPDLHLVRTEKAPFMDSLFGLIKHEYACIQPGIADLKSLERLCSDQAIRLVCTENSHNFGGGVCASVDHLKQLYQISQARGIKVHLDGARLFNAAIHLNATGKDFAQSADTVMFCLSKGLGAPFGSLLCGTKEFIAQARENRKLIGGGLRQGGIMAAAGIVALSTGIERLAEDNANAAKLGAALANYSTCKLIPVETNIVMLDITQTGKASSWFEQQLAPLGLLVKGMGIDHLRLTTYRGISGKDIDRAIEIFDQFMVAHKLA